jgi:hypothetical protein
MYFDRKTTVALRSRVAIIRPLMNAFYLSGAFILLRSVYRTVGRYNLIQVVCNINVSQNLLQSTSTRDPLPAISITPNGHTMSLTPYRLPCVSYYLLLRTLTCFDSWPYSHTISCFLPSTFRRRRVKRSKRRIRSEWRHISNYNVHTFLAIFFCEYTL